MGLRGFGQTTAKTAGLANPLGTDLHPGPGCQGRASHGGELVRPETRIKADPVPRIGVSHCRGADSSGVLGTCGGDGVHKSGIMTQLRTEGARAALKAMD
jgi:hypothetical protein